MSTKLPCLIGFFSLVCLVSVCFNKTKKIVSIYSYLMFRFRIDSTEKKLVKDACSWCYFQIVVFVVFDFFSFNKSEFLFLLQKYCGDCQIEIIIVNFEWNRKTNSNTKTFEKKRSNSNDSFSNTNTIWPTCMTCLDWLIGFWLKKFSFYKWKPKKKWCSLIRHLV